MAEKRIEVWVIDFVYMGQQIMPRLYESREEAVAKNYGTSLRPQRATLIIHEPDPEAPDGE